MRAIIPPYVKGIKVTPKTNPNDIKSIADFDNNFIKGANALDNKYYQDNQESILANLIKRKVNKQIINQVKTNLNYHLKIQKKFFRPANLLIF